MTRINTYFTVAVFCLFLSPHRSTSQLFTDCEQLPENLTQTYLSTRDTVLSNLRDRSSLGSYSNATAGLSPNSVYGMFLCIGDINRTSCSNCVHTATFAITKTCDSHKGAFRYNDECMVRYSNFSFVTLVEDAPIVARNSPPESLESLQFFNQTLPGKVDDLIHRVSSSSQIPYFVEDQERVTQLEGSYDLEAMAQCSPDLEPSNCTVCLKHAVEIFSECCHNARSADIVFHNCLIKYDISALHTSLGISVREGNLIFGRMLIAMMTALVLAQMGL